MTAKLDFLRLATWNVAEYTHTISEMMLRDPGGWEPAKWLQYKGKRKGSIFFGMGEQKGARHCVINISGFESDEFVKGWQLSDGWYATRLDVQVTIAEPIYVNLPEIYARINQHVKSSLIQSDLNDTLYVGVRTSDIFTRLYEKPLDIMYLRLEFELKGSRSRAAWRAINTGAEIAEVFKFYLDRSKLPDDIRGLYVMSGVDATERAMNEEIKKDDLNTLKWLMSIDAAVMKALNNHAIGGRVSQIVESWANYSANLDIIAEND